MDAHQSPLADRIAHLAELLAELAAAVAEQSAAAPAPAPSSMLLDVGEAARQLGISKSTLYNGPIRRGELRTVLIDTRRLVPRVALDAYVADLMSHAS